MAEDAYGTTSRDSVAVDEKIGIVQEQVERGKLLMNDNIQKAVNNVEAVAVLSDKAEDLEAQSSLFRTEAVAARRQECFKKWKLNLCLAAVVVAAVLILVWPYLSGGGDDDRGRR